MSRIAYVNGRYLPHKHASIHIEDRGFQFADAVYEVIAVRRGRLIDEAMHLGRLHRSLRELRIAPPMSDAAMHAVMAEVVRRNRVVEGMLYLQISRGSAPRDFAFPNRVKPSLVMTSRRTRGPAPRLIEEGVGVITIDDIRWARPDIKSVSLLPNALGKQRAKEVGAYEAWQVDAAGNVTEGTSSNAWIVTAAGDVITRQADTSILNGITRIGLIGLLEREGLRVVERPFTVAEAKGAREAFLTSTTNFVLPIVAIDGTPIGNGHPGSVVRKLRQVYDDYATAQSQAQ
ncbi:MAG TPA: D-amino-acid transaminase [Stellaceae bacterium]|nr:D-amino-acid transaminase [Stellaceae bacterium]